MEQGAPVELTSGASGRIILVIRKIRRSAPTPDSLLRALIFLHSITLWFLLLIRSRSPLSWKATATSAVSQVPLRLRNGGGRWSASVEDEDVRRRRALAEETKMGSSSEEGVACRCETFVFEGPRRNSLFCRSWLPSSGDLRGVVVILHGLNEHSGRYSRFATQLNACDFGVYAMDWIGHGGSDGLHGYVPSLDYVVEDTVKFLKKIKHEHEGVPCLLFGHSTGGAIVLKAACFPHIETMVEGVIMTSPALRVTPSHPIVGAVAPLISLVLPKLQFKGASKPGIAVSRDPAALSAKYSDPLVYTGPIRVRTGHEILRLSSYLLKKMKSITVPFLVMHGTADRVTDPLASMDLYNVAASKRKDIRLYEGLLHDLLFEPERDEVVADIINWIKRRLEQKSDEVNESMEKAI
ncbi:monoacylglycerol lipase-like [Zingiber officinale]|uniref:monoacylglycerol lipase-like n=1 Tax=Zingiber officinale TaxID=94328 RepID=UPI001C4B14CA|nr:monoacylglycerol lipase-like [Zingiber officinale]